MKILKITLKPLDPIIHNMMESIGLVYHYSSPTPLSALTSMKVARAIENFSPDIVEVNRQKDAIAVISAKKITKGADYKIVYRVEPNTEPPRIIHKDIIEGVDCWIFPSQRLYDKYPTNIKRKTQLPIVALSTIEIDLPSEFEHPLTISWIGEIKDGQTIKRLLEQVDLHDGRFNLRICGAGSAKDVMPAVRLSRSLKNNDKVTWVGEEYKLKNEISLCHAAILTGKDLSEIESTILQAGRCVITIDEIGRFIESPHIYKLSQEDTPQAYLNKLRSIYTSII